MNDYYYINTNIKEDFIDFTGGDGGKGFKGHRGPMGQSGLKGLNGPIGPRGDRGPRGIPGIPGDDGDIGERGDRGKKGDRGIKGDVGMKGKTGPRGIKGIKGPRGNIGDQINSTEKGLKGNKGSRGDSGKSSSNIKTKLEKCCWINLTEDPERCPNNGPMTGIKGQFFKQKQKFRRKTCWTTYDGWWHTTCEWTTTTLWIDYFREYQIKCCSVGLTDPNGKKINNEYGSEKPKNKSKCVPI